MCIFPWLQWLAKKLKSDLIQKYVISKDSKILRIFVFTHEILTLSKTKPMHIKCFFSGVDYDMKYQRRMLS